MTISHIESLGNIIILSENQVANHCYKRTLTTNIRKYRKNLDPLLDTPK